MKQGSGANKTGPADVRAPAAKAKETSRSHIYFDASLASDLSSFRRVFQAGLERRLCRRLPVRNNRRGELARARAFQNMTIGLGAYTGPTIAVGSTGTVSLPLTTAMRATTVPLHRQFLLHMDHHTAAGAHAVVRDPGQKVRSESIEAGSMHRKL